MTREEKINKLKEKFSQIIDDSIVSMNRDFDIDLEYSGLNVIVGYGEIVKISITIGE